MPDSDPANPAELRAQQLLGKTLSSLIRQFPKQAYQFLSLYFRLETEGWHNLPRNSRALVVSNHSDAMGLDAFMLGFCISDKFKRVPRIMAHKFWFSSPFLEAFARSFSLFPADLKEGLQVLKNDRMLVIFPEGPEGNFKVSSGMYRLVDFNPGFVPLAIMQKAPVIPAVIIGAEETHYNMAKLDQFKDMFGSPIPLPLNIIPFPVKWKIKFLKPIDFSKYNKKDIKDARFVKEINQNIRYRIQHEINKELKKRKVSFR